MPILSGTPDCAFYKTERVFLPSGELGSRQPAGEYAGQRLWCEHRHSPLTLRQARGEVGASLPCGGVRAACTIPAEQRGALPPR
jgi:hypothetical protein